MFWYGGYVMLSLLVIIYLEDEHSVGSFNLSLLFFLMCVSVILGAILTYFLKFQFNMWTTALIFYGIWVFIPFMIYIKSFELPLYVNVLMIVTTGISFGVIDSIKYSIYATLIPKSEEGKYMGIFFFTSRLMDFFGNIFILVMMKLFKIKTVISLTSVFLVAAFSILLFVVVKGIHDDPPEEIGEPLSSEVIDLSE